MIHPLFEPLPDRRKAEIFSDVMSGRYTFASGGPDQPVAPDSTWPQEPTYIAAMAISYLEDDNFRSQHVDLHPNQLSREEESLLYEQRVGGYQSVVAELDALIQVTEYEDLRTYYLERLRQSGDRVLAAWLVGRSATSGVLLDSLATPKSIA